MQRLIIVVVEPPSRCGRTIIAEFAALTAGMVLVYAALLLAHGFGG